MSKAVEEIAFPFDEQVSGHWKSHGSSPNPFDAKSVLKSTEIALKLTAKSITESLRMAASGEKNKPDKNEIEIAFEHDEMSLDPMEDDDYDLKKILSDQNDGCCDQALEKCLSPSMIPEEFVEGMLCDADKTFATCKITEWMEEATGYSMCTGDDDDILVSDDDSKSTDGLPSSMNGKTSPNTSKYQLHGLSSNMGVNDSVINSKEEALDRKDKIQLILQNGLERPDKIDRSKLKIITTILSSQLDIPMTSDAHRSDDGTYLGLDVGDNSKSIWEHTLQNLSDEEFNAFWKEYNGERLRRMDDYESGFECVLRHKLPSDEEKDDEAAIISSLPTKLSVTAEEDATIKRIVTPPSEERSKNRSILRFGRLTKKLSFNLSKTKAKI